MRLSFAIRMVCVWKYCWKIWSWMMVNGMDKILYLIFGIYRIVHVPGAPLLYHFTAFPDYKLYWCVRKQDNKSRLNLFFLLVTPCKHNHAICGGDRTRTRLIFHHQVSPPHSSPPKKGSLAWETLVRMMMMRALTLKLVQEGLVQYGVSRKMQNFLEQEKFQEKKFFIKDWNQSHHLDRKKSWPIMKNQVLEKLGEGLEGMSTDNLELFNLEIFPFHHIWG